MYIFSSCYEIIEKKTFRCRFGYTFSVNRLLGATVVTHSPRTSEVGRSNPNVEKMVVLTDGWQFTEQNLDQLYVLFSFAHKTTCSDMTSTVLKGTLKPK